MNIGFKNTTTFFFVWLIGYTIGVQAQFSHYFQNYALSDYKAGNQNWDVSKADDGKLYVANNDGLLEFDGLNWNFWGMPNKTTIRSVLAHKDKIFVGSYEEFGYFIRDEKGILNYSSLVDLIVEKEKNNDEEFWQTIVFKDAIVFRSFSSIHIYNKNKLKSYYLPSIIMSCDIVENRLFVSTLSNGIFVFNGSNFEPFFDSEVLRNSKIVSILALDNYQLLINTELKGSFIVENNRIFPWETAINPILKKHQLNRFSRFGADKFVFGTIKDGVYISNKKGEILFHINRQSGILNNTVLGQLVTKENELWLGLDNGIAFIDLKTPNYFYNDVSGRLGAVYDIINFKNRIYIGSNTGLYVLDNERNLQFIENSQGQVWDLNEINGELFCGHNNGTYLVKNNKLELISTFTGGWVIKKIPEQENSFIQGTYTGLVSFKKISNKWEIQHLGKTTIPARFLVFEDKQTAWIAHVNKGVYRVKFDANYTKIIEMKNYLDKGLYSDFSVKIYKIKNNITFKTLKGWQKYEALLDSIVPHNLLSENFPDNSYIISEDNVSKAALITENAILFNTILNPEGGFSIGNKYFKKRLVTGFEKISKLNDSSFALSLQDGFMIISPQFHSNLNQLRKPVIERIYLNNELHSTTLLSFKIPYKNNSIKLMVSSAFSKDHSFEYTLSNSSRQTNWIEAKKGVVELSKLSNGSYNLLIRSINNDAKSEILAIEIEVLAPWYKNTIGFVIYAFLILLVGLMMYLTHKRKMRKVQDFLRVKFEEEQSKMLEIKKRESEKEIINLKTETLKNEVKLKSKQLANTAMALVKKNEILQNLKDELVTNKDNFNNQYSFKKLIKQINNSIEHEDQWEIFEYNFNQVHEEFFKHLTSSFPSLTHKDLKICAYLKMNLSTKEIAPLLNISTRGIETHRYRLKLKLGLEKQDSLRGFLQKIN
ncbi:LuxR C-terminal-related transcriptional regulator [Lutibacter sp.]|uniref:helix-turn-helix and ligand-binding sensor domain-containing protein n=1 Tax=Lutibacter sp. TaxID=1925666 RepID=UPI0027338387|nr:LuxR C-terminal-related transcriptional regulator [Lutibacter sp.]MDP3314103.1 LuxR C-terminal-related transcriptional regulator [Lutibacter sp.]